MKFRTDDYLFFSKPSFFLSVMAYCVSCVGETCVRFQMKIKYSTMWQSFEDA